MKYRKKPIVVDAIQWTGENDIDVIYFSAGKAFEINGALDGLRHLAIQTLEGMMSADIGDWIICGVKGEFYPCKSDIFEATYEAVIYDDVREVPA